MRIEMIWEAGEDRKRITTAEAIELTDDQFLIEGMERALKGCASHPMTELVIRGDEYLLTLSRTVHF